MFALLLITLVAAGVVHARKTGPSTAARTAECILVYVLAGYCGVAQVIVGGSAFFSTHVVEHLARVADVGEMMPWFASMYVGAAVAATLAIWRRGDYLLAPVIVWAAFFAGATWAHLHTEAVHGRVPGVHGTLWILASHALVSAILVVAWVTYRRSPRP